MRVHKSKIILLTVSLCALGAAAVFSTANADSISDTQSKIQALQKEIDQYNTLLNTTSKQSQTLSNALKTLELTQKKLETNLALTGQNISKTNQTLQGLDRDIADTETKIDAASAVISLGMRQIAVAESQSAVENFLNNKSISETWNYMNAIHALQSKIKEKLDDLITLQTTLQNKKGQVTTEKTKLVTYQKNLSDQKEVVLSTKQEKAKLLADTSGREEAYRKILAQKVAEQDAYEKELFSYESRLQITLAPGEVPAPNHNLLSWPIDNVKITQYFGKTVSARRLYVSGTHNGIDFKASIGTPIKAALSGIVADTEPSKSKSGCQYGKYVLIRHPNGLSTIYGHLSVVSVKPGDIVTTGDTIGYSGSTGYATGPHLHLGLYVTAGIRMVDSSALGSARCAGIKTIAAPTNAYLDPMAYLPTL